MKIKATPIALVSGDASGDAVTLGNDGEGELIVDPPLLPVVERPAQVVELAFAENQFAAGRGNRLRSFAWVVARDHESAAAAAEFVHRHEGEVPINCSLEITEGSQRWIYSRAVINRVECREHYGKATACRYAVVGAVLAAAETD